MLPTTSSPRVSRHLPVGAEILPDGAGVHFRVWAPTRRSVDVALESGSTKQRLPLQPEDNGYFSAIIEQASAGSLYRFVLDGGPAFPDPASRFQPQGPHGPSQVVDWESFSWTDHAWRGVPLKGQVIYEFHVGTFTPEGTWRAAAQKLPYLKETGITVLEMMPVAEFAGRFGWGYDGVDLFAPTRLYGSPDDLRFFVDRAHATGLGVILDVVYNHFGPDGCYLREFSPAYFTDRYQNEWGESINFDGPGSDGVREFFSSNAEYWIREFHLDGLRLDATHRIFDSSPRHILSEVGEAVRRGAGQRATIVVAETETQESFLARPPEEGGCGLDALWNDDYHHSAMVALTGRIEGYYTDFRGTPQELISALKFGFLFQGQWHKWLKQRRGSPSRDLDPAAFVIFLENHDQVSNSADGKRLHLMTSPGRYRALTCLTLLAPATPMLFQGQEFASSSPFVFFADHEPGLARLVRKGRTEFLTQFGRAADPAMSRNIPDPADPQSFESCRINWHEQERNSEAYSLHCDLLRLRREDPVFAMQKHHAVDGAVLASSAFVVRFFGETAGDRLIIVNLGHDLRLESVAEPLMAAPPGMRWEVIWSSEDPRYGGSGTPPVQTKETWNLPAEAAVVLKLAAEE